MIHDRWQVTRGAAVVPMSGPTKTSGQARRKVSYSTEPCIKQSYLAGLRVPVLAPSPLGPQLHNAQLVQHGAHAHQDGEPGHGGPCALTDFIVLFFCFPEWKVSFSCKPQILTQHCEQKNRYNTVIWGLPFETLRGVSLSLWATMRNYGTSFRTGSYQTLINLCIWTFAAPWESRDNRQGLCKLASYFSLLIASSWIHACLQTMQCASRT